MKRVHKGTSSFLSVLLSMAVALLLAGCGGGGGGATGGGTPATTTTISGKVTLSSTVTGKPTMMAAMLNKARLHKSGKGNKPDASQDANLLKALSATTLSATALNSATIELYDADRPEWLSPVAVALSDSTGTYTLSTLINAASNLNEDGTAAYVDGADIPTGNYTIIASKYDSGYGKLFVAVQAIVQTFAGTVAGNDLVAQDSDAIPTVVSMIGLAKNTDGTFGSTTTPVPANANIQVTFSMAMARVSVVDGMAIVASGSTTPLEGKWKVSPDLTAVTFYPTEDLVPNTVYTITVGGGKSLKTAKNVYGKAIAADVKGSFKSAAKDSTPPSVIRNSPANATIANDMPITTPIRIGADEEMDITSIAVTSSPSIGDKPAVKYVGKSTAAADVNYPYIYEIAPSDSLTLATTYAVGVSGGVDMAGNTMVGSTAINFTTEATSAGISGTAAEIDVKLAAKDVLGKWVNAMNARNSALLASYMSGDFVWVNDTSQGNKSSEDLNRDGRLSLNEFTAMLDSWFQELDHCGSTVTGDVDTGNAYVDNGIAVSGATVTLAFNLTITPTNTTDLSCNDNGPDGAMYAVMEDINGAWMMTRGSDFYLATYPAALTPIELVSPANGSQFADPSLGSTPLTPEFKWTAGTDISTYMVILIDNKSRHLQTGWVALVDGTSTAAGSPLAVKFNGTPGDYGNMIVLDTGGDGNGPLGFEDMITEVKSGGSYSWAVIGFSTKTIAEFKTLNFDPATYLVASSVNNGFTVNGFWKALTIKVASGTTVYDYSDNSGGYNVGSDSSVTLTITTPDLAATTANVSVNGYTWKNYQPTFDTSGVASVTIPLSDNMNWVQVCDNFVPEASGPGTCNGFSDEFSISTSGGAAPKIVISSVTAKTCAGATATLGTQDAWGRYSSADACTVTISGSVDSSITGNLSVNVWNNDGNGNYSTQVTPSGLSFGPVEVPVYAGQNWVSVNHWNNTTSENNQNGFSVDTLAGSTYTAPISATIATGATMTSSDIWQSYWNVDSAATTSVTVNVSMPFNAGTGYYSIYSDPNWTSQGSGSFTGTTASIPVSLVNGWNYISLQDSAYNWYTVYIYTTGGTVYTPPNVVTSIAASGATTSNPIAGYGYYQYDAGSACSVTVNGTTTNAGNLYVYLNYYNSTSGASVYEYQTISTTGSYSFSQGVYGGGINSIDIYDANWNWQGVQVATTCINAPVVFGVSSVKAGGTSTTLTADTYGTYNTTASSVDVTGTATTGKTITAYVSGQYYATYTATAASNAYTIPLPIYTGYNYISLTDGSNWTYLNVSTTGGTAYTPPINTVTVSGATLASGGGTSDTWSSWNTSAGTADIAGSVTGTGTSTGYYYQSSNYSSTSGSLPISGGAFSLTGVVLDYGYNYIDLYDANWNYYSVVIYTSGGTQAPVKVVEITSPTQGATASGATTVSGTIATSGFTPAYVYGYVYDYVTGVSTYYSNDATDQTSYGYQPLAYDSASGAFSFTASVTSPNTTMIQVYAYDADWMTSHGHYVYVNNTAGYTDSYWKPGAKATAKSAKAKAHQTEFAKKMMSRKAR